MLDLVNFEIIKKYHYPNNEIELVRGIYGLTPKKLQQKVFQLI